MFSERARTNLLRRGFGPASFLGFFADSFRESVHNIRLHSRLAGSIVLFSTGFHVAVLAALLFVYFRVGESVFPQLYHRLAGFTALGYAGFTAWLLMYVGLIRDDTGRIRDSVGLANHLTAARFYLIVPVVVLFAHGLYAAALVVYALLGLTDVADGVVARRRGEQTEFGVVMDPLADILSTAAVFAAFLAGGFIPGWLFVILMVRYGMLIVGSFVLFLATGPIRFRATIPGKIVGVLQGIGIIIIVWCLWRGVGWRDSIAPVLFPALGVFFASIVVSQTVLGYRHLKRLGARKQGGGFGPGR
jgi:phosphatidylglycerophosphate synthase